MKVRKARKEVRLEHGWQFEHSMTISDMGILTKRIDKEVKDVPLAEGRPQLIN
jgi:hypothetical protein